jgi:hypothetical protein
VIRLVLLLLGADFIRERWRLLAIIGAVWGLLGLALFIDALDGVVYFPIHLFGYLLIIEALVTLVATTSNRGTHAGTVPYCVGLGLMLSGFGTLRLALRLRKLAPQASMLALLARGDGESVSVFDAEPVHDDKQLPLLTVHVWTPVGAAVDAVPQPVLDRYVAAVDGQGVISTGHAALDVPDVLYISHYPANEIDHSPEDFRAILRATKENNVPGKFQPTYAIESAGWVESTAKVTFERYNLGRHRQFWSRYCQDTTYNLTNRNCSSTVAMALEVSMEGALGGSRQGMQKSSPP